MQISSTDNENENVQRYESCFIPLFASVGKETCRTVSLSVCLLCTYTLYEYIYTNISQERRLKVPMPPQSPIRVNNIITIANPTLLDIDAKILGDHIFSFLIQSEWIYFASVCKHCMISFQHYLYFASKSRNAYAKHVPMRALRQYLMRKTSEYYPLQLLHLLKQC